MIKIVTNSYLLLLSSSWWCKRMHRGRHWHYVGSYYPFHDYVCMQCNKLQTKQFAKKWETKD